MNETMVCLDQERLYDEEDVRRVVIQADTAPSTMPTTGEGVAGLADTAHIAPGSLLLVLSTSKKFLMSTAGNWVEWTA